MSFPRLIPFLLVPAMCLLVSIPAEAARKSVPVVNIEREAWPPKPAGTPTDEQVKEAILKGGRRCKYPWISDSIAEGKITMTTLVRGKHQAWVDVEYTTTDFSIRYVKSDNLNYERRHDEREYIHPFYNDWIRELAENMKIELVAAD